MVLKEGQSQVCAGGSCVELINPGDTAVITANGPRIDIAAQSSSSWSFDSECNGMCTPMSFAQAEDALTTGSIGGLGGAAGGGGPTTAFGLSGGSSGGGTGGSQQTSVPHSAPPSLLASGGSSGGGSFASVSPH